MRSNDAIKWLLPNRRYICMDTLIMVIFYLAISTTAILGIQLFLVSLGITFHTLIDLRLLEPYLSMDSNILFGVSVFVIFCSILGLLSVIQYSHIGIITGIGILLLLLSFTDAYAISDYRVKNYLSTTELHNVLYESMKSNPLDNMEFHFMQKRLACCGIVNYTDWQYALPFIPGSCCNNSTICSINDPSLNKNGCLTIIRTILNNIYDNTIAIIMALNIVGITSIFAGFFCSYVMRQLKKGGRILSTAIPRIQMYNAARGQQTAQIPNMQNNTPSVQIISGHSIPSPPPIYPNLQAPNL